MNQNIDEIMLILTEECAEVIQSISKCQRFGFYNFKPGKDITNIQHLESEIGDLLCMIQLLIDHGVIAETALQDAKKQKLHKLSLWSNITLTA